MKPGAFLSWVITAFSKFCLMKLTASEMLLSVQRDCPSKTAWSIETPFPPPGERQHSLLLRNDM